MESRIQALILIVLVVLFPALVVESLVRHYSFRVVLTNTTRLCSAKTILTVNGRFPGPTLYANEGDTIIVRVTNHANHNVTIHWHGVRQLRTGWADGPAYITQCPIQPRQKYVYNFTITGQRGTLLWHAHVNWIRATVHGAIVILPKKGAPYPFPQPEIEKIIILGEWWKADVEAVLSQATQAGVPPNLSDAHTINGHPGPFPGCSFKGTYDLGIDINFISVSQSIFFVDGRMLFTNPAEIYTLHVESGKTYLLRIINAAMNDELFFKVAGHKLTIVEADASYIKPFETDTIFLSPGQTTNALLIADKAIGKYLIAVSPFKDAPTPIDNLTTFGTLRYKGTPSFPTTTLTTVPPQNATPVANSFTNSLRSVNSKEYPAQVPLTVDHSLFFTVSVGLNPCATCLNGTKFVADINNVSFVMPTTALLQAQYYKIQGVFTDDFPAKPPLYFNYTGNSPSNLKTNNGTSVYRLAFNSTVQVVIQGTSVIAPESHPTHLHGYNFYVVGKGLGNFDSAKDPKKFNLIDPVERNTVGVPTAGWTAIRFRADNPGVWLLHCHLEVHTTWGLKMAFLVGDGEGPNESLLPPPSDLPWC